MSSKRPPPRSSGEHPAVIAFREKMDSIQEHTVPAAVDLAEQALALKEKTSPPIPRAEGDEEIPVDVVLLPPRPSPKKRP